MESSFCVRPTVCVTVGYNYLIQGDLFKREILKNRRRFRSFEKWQQSDVNHEVDRFGKRRDLGGWLSGYEKENKLYLQRYFMCDFFRLEISSDIFDIVELG